MGRVFITTAASFFLTCLGLSAQDQDYATGYIWCHLEVALDTAYFSEVLVGDRNKTGEVAVTFRKYLREHHDHAEGVAGCKWSRDKASATSDRDQAKAEAKKTFRNVTQTTWPLN
jgi:hypothetical protein